MFIKIASLAAMTVLTIAANDTLPDLKPGDALPVPDLKMKDVTGKAVSLKELSGRNGLLVVFSCNTCPFVIGSEGSEGWEGRYPELAAFSQRMGVAMALVNSNEAKRSEGDGFADMQKHYKEKNYGGAYLLDVGHVAADAFGARTTPHVFLFDKDGKLVYKGAIDDSVGSAAAVKEPWLRNAITNLVEGKAIDPAVTRNVGCSIKRVAPAP
ncbi:MAG TPA: redoxin family protein [Flavobacteriales bacterium]|nr:redoxin family protein [Flavobacteriales bacterium]